MRKLTLDEAWDLTLEMWSWIVKQKGDVPSLKVRWLKEHKFPFDYLKLKGNCFFCEYDKQNKERGCSQCPGKLVDKTFFCYK